MARTTDCTILLADNFVAAIIAEISNILYEVQCFGYVILCKIKTYILRPFIHYQIGFKSTYSCEKVVVTFCDLFILVERLFRLFRNHDYFSNYYRSCVSDLLRT